MRFLAEAEICSPRTIIRTVTVIADIDRQVAKRRWAKHVDGLRSGSKIFVAMYPLQALCMDDKVFYNQRSNRPDVEVDTHERFHLRASKRGLGSDGSNPMEESAAYAFESTLASNRRAEQLEIEAQARIYWSLARHCVRFMYSLQLPEPNGLLRSSVQGIRRLESDEVIGDGRAMALGNARNFLLYIECTAILRRWGARDAEKIFFDAIKIAEQEGLERARQFLLSKLTRRAREELSDGYGIDMRKYRCRSPNAPDRIDETMIWNV